MSTVTRTRPPSDDLWLAAVEQLTNEQRASIDFDKPQKTDILSDLLDLTKDAKKRSIEKAWKFTRRNGEIVVIRDILSKVAGWIDRFRTIGDIVVAFDPAHAALPWAGVRFLLQIATDDIKTFNFAFENILSLAELISRHAVVEGLLLQTASSAARDELRNALIRLYTDVLTYLAKARAYFLQPTRKRALKSMVISSDLQSCFDAITTTQLDVDRCFHMASLQDQLDKHTEMKQIMARFEAPISRWDSELTKITDQFGRAKRTKILKWLSVEPYSRHHKQTRKNVLEGTGQWLLHDPVYLKWKEESASSVLWLHGIPGSGKSKLVSLVVEEALHAFENQNMPPPAYFYCSRSTTELGRSDPDKIMASIARQLSTLGPDCPLLHPTVAAYKQWESDAFSDGSISLDDSLALIMDLAALYPMVTIIIDALDECNPDVRRHLLEGLQSILQKSPTLVKIFVSSRDDQDIVYRLEKYPNLEISSKKNTGDINKFVAAETVELIASGDLLRYSKRKDELSRRIINQVALKADGMFRWASLQLQALCQLHSDAAILERIDRPPPKLEELYQEILDRIDSSASDADRLYARNTLSWLLCARWKQDVDEFLMAVSAPVSSDYPATKEQILGVCCNLVLFDTTLDIFRFAHLSVREFLEKKSQYSSTKTNALVAETCLGTLIRDFGFEAQYLSNFGQRSLHYYSSIWWGFHCQAADDERQEGTLRQHLVLFLAESATEGSPYFRWMEEVRIKQRDIVFARLPPREGYDVNRRLQWCSSRRNSVIVTACVFDLYEVVKRNQAKLENRVWQNLEGSRCLDAVARFGNLRALDLLLAVKTLRVTESTPVMAMGNMKNGNEVMDLLLRRREKKDIITVEVAKAAVAAYGIMALTLLPVGDFAMPEKLIVAAAGDWVVGAKVIAFLLAERGNQVTIPEEVVVKAVHKQRSAELLTILLRERGHEVSITERVVMEAVGNQLSGWEILTALLRERGHEVTITKGVVMAAAQNRLSGWEILALLFTERGHEVHTTGEAFVGAFGSYSIGWDALTFLLEELGYEVKMTQVVMKGVRSHQPGKKVLTFLLEELVHEIEVTEELIRRVSHLDPPCRAMVVSLLLQKGQKQVKVTTEFVDKLYDSTDEEVVTLLNEKLV